MDELPIIYSLDDNFAPHCAASIASILQNVSNQRIVHFYIITDSFSDENRDKIQATTQLKACSLSFIDIDPNDEELSKIRVPRPWTNSILYRLKIPSLLNRCSKAIYLDADTIITDDICKLFALDISNYILGACDEYDCSPETACIQSKKLGLPRDIGYFNTGVLLLNLQKMREEEIEEKCLDLINTDGNSVLSFPDQDVLNITTDGRYLHLPETWNTQIWAKKNFPRIYRRKRLPKIIHFAGDRKPWKTNKFKMFLSLSQKAGCFRQYFKYLKYTPWGNPRRAW